MNRPVSALFVNKDSIYKTLLNDCYDIERDARTFSCSNAIVAHPPCRGWGKLSHLSNHDQDELDLATFAIELIRKNGGVLEHPESSRLFKYMNIPKPGQYDAFGGYLLSIYQSWFGHRAQKKTLLYICGLPIHLLPNYPISFDLVEYTISSSQRVNRHPNRKKQVTYKERSATPLSLAKYLIDIASMTNPNY